MKSSVLLAVALSSFAFPAHAAKVRVVKVRKSNGAVSPVVLLPVHLQPSHREVVKKRFIESHAEDVSQMPAKHVISNSILPAVRDQGHRNSCVYFATLSLMESYYMKTQVGKQSLDLSEQCLLGLNNWLYDSDYDGENKPDARPDPNGDFPPRLARVITQFGVPREMRYSQMNCLYTPKTASRDISPDEYADLFSDAQTSATSRPFGKGKSFDINNRPTTKNIVALLASDIPVEVGVFVYPEFMKTYHWRYPGTGSKIVGGHAIVLTGYARDDAGRLIFKFKNSWGTNWGEGGYGTIDEKSVVSSWSNDPNFDFIVSLY